MSAASSGTVTSASTSVVESPGASVWTSTSGGANSGNTSSGVVRSVRHETTTAITASATTMIRCRSDSETSQAIMSVTRPEFRAEQLRGAGGHDFRARLDTAGDDDEVAGVPGDLDAASCVGAVAAILVDPRAAADVVEHRAIGHDESAARWP